MTFAVADADEIAERAAELGGTVVAAPFDAPWVRTTVIADPQGAAFSRAGRNRRGSSLAARPREAMQGL